MSDDYDVGYGKPPQQHRFKPGNQAAKGKKARVRQQTLSMPEIFEKALRTKRKIKRGDQVFTMDVADILVERLVLMMTTGTARELATIIAMLERYAPDVLTALPETLEVTYHRAEGSTVALPPANLWERPKP